jgi:hypothetical protein
MVIHPDYPETVRAALASDQYWLAGGVVPSLLERNEIEGATRFLRNQIKVRRDGEMAGRIGSIVKSLSEGDTITPLAWGDELPIPHGRQVVRVIEDSRRISSLFDPFYLLERISASRHNKQLEKLVKEYPDFHVPDFEESLEQIHSGKLYPPDANAIVRYDRAKVAQLTRGVRYVRFDEKLGHFIALPSLYTDMESEASKMTLVPIPRVKIGDVYNKDIAGNELGRIASAILLEARSVTWRHSPKTPPKKKQRVITDSLLPKPVQASA